MNTVASTFRSFPDGSGAEAFVTLRSGAKVALTFDVAGKTVTRVIGQDGASTSVLGYGKAKGMAKSEVKKAVEEFEACIEALGPEWMQLNRAMYEGV